MLTEAVKRHCAELRAVTASALADAKALNNSSRRRNSSATASGGPCTEGSVGAQYGPEGTGTVLLLLHHTVLQLATTLQEQADFVAAHPGAAATADVELARHEKDDAAETILQLRFDLEAERQRSAEAADKLQERDKLLGMIKEHMLRETVHLAAGGTANLGAFPVELIDTMELVAARSRVAAERKILSQETAFQQQLSRAKSHSNRQLEAKEKEVVQMQLHFRNTIRSLQAAHAEDVRRLDRELKETKSQLVAAEQTAIAKASKYFHDKYRDVITGTEIESDKKALIESVQQSQATQAKVDILERERRLLQQQLTESQRSLASIRDDLTSRVQTLMADVSRSEANRRIEVGEKESTIAVLARRIVDLEAQARGKEAQQAMEQDALAAEINILRDEAVVKNAIAANATTSLATAQRLYAATSDELRAAHVRVALLKELCETNGIDTGDEASETNRTRSNEQEVTSTQAAKQVAQLDLLVAELQAQVKDLQEQLVASRKAMSISSYVPLPPKESDEKATQCTLVSADDGAGAAPSSPAAAPAHPAFSKKGHDATMGDRKVNATLRARLTQLFHELQTAETRYRGLVPAQQCRRPASSSMSSDEGCFSRPGRAELAPIPQLTKEDVAQQNTWFIDEMRSREAELERLLEAIAQEEVTRMRSKFEDDDGRDDHRRSSAEGGASTSPQGQDDDDDTCRTVVPSAATFANSAAAQSAFRVILPINGVMPTPSSFKANVSHLRDILRNKFDQQSDEQARPKTGASPSTSTSNTMVPILNSPRSAGGGASTMAMRPKRPASARQPPSRSLATDQDGTTSDDLVSLLRKSIFKASEPSSYFCVSRTCGVSASGSVKRPNAASGVTHPAATPSFGPPAPTVAVTSYGTPRSTTSKKTA